MVHSDTRFLPPQAPTVRPDQFGSLVERRSEALKAIKVRDHAQLEGQRCVGQEDCSAYKMVIRKDAVHAIPDGVHENATPGRVLQVRTARLLSHMMGDSGQSVLKVASALIDDKASLTVLVSEQAMATRAVSTIAHGNPCGSPEVPHVATQLPTLECGGALSDLRATSSSRTLQPCDKRKEALEKHLQSCQDELKKALLAKQELKEVWKKGQVPGTDGAEYMEGAKTGIVQTRCASPPMGASEDVARVDVGARQELNPESCDAHQGRNDTGAWAAHETASRPELGHLAPVMSHTAGVSGSAGTPVAKASLARAQAHPGVIAAKRKREDLSPPCEESTIPAATSAGTQLAESVILLQNQNRSAAKHEAKDDARSGEADTPGPPCQSLPVSPAQASQTMLTTPPVSGSPVQQAVQARVNQATMRYPISPQQGMVVSLPAAPESEYQLVNSIDGQASTTSAAAAPALPPAASGAHHPQEGLVGVGHVGVDVHGTVLTLSSLLTPLEELFPPIEVPRAHRSGVIAEMASNSSSLHVILLQTLLAKKGPATNCQGSPAQDLVDPRAQATPQIHGCMYS